MARGLIMSKTITAIANAVRIQEGSTGAISPDELPARIRALDGTRQGEPTQAEDTLNAVGFVDDALLSGIADAIRAHNGQSATYLPSEMAPAILALSWDAGVKPRALLLSNGTVEFNFREGVSTSVYGVDVVKVWDVDPAGYASAGARPWNNDKLSMTAVYIAPDFQGSGVRSTAYWFHGCVNLIEVRGFEALQGAEAMNQMFMSCASLETVYAATPPTSVKSGSLMFSGCTRLVGGLGYVPKQTDTHAKLTYDGVLTDPAYDLRRWMFGFAYADGELVISRSEFPDEGREVLARGGHCVNARYNAVGATPWHVVRDKITRITIDGDMTHFTQVHTNYWFYGMSKVASIAGMRNLRGVGEMQHTFNSCSGLTSLDLRGFDPSGLTSLFYTFSGCKALRTITADAGWALPESGLSGSGTFNGCTSLVGGNGTAYSSGAIAYTYMRIDKEGEPGYLTAG